MNFRVSERLLNLPNYPFVEITREVGRLQAEGHDIIRLDMGSPDLDPPESVRQLAADLTLASGKHGYTNYRGVASFRQAVARYYQRLFHVELDPETEILPLLGSKEGLVNMTMATISPGDVVLVPSPAYPSYEQGARLAGGETYFLPLREENGFLPDFSQIPAEIRERARLLWMNYPHNPTGALAGVDDFARAVDFCQENDILLGSDNPYFAVVFDGEHAPSALQAPGAKECTVEFMSLSKSHNMAGWRLGAAVGKREAIAALLKIKSNIDSGHFLPIYEAGVCALDNVPQSWVDERNAHYKQRRDLLAAAMPQMGLSLPGVPKGSIYVWAAVPGGDDVAYCREALHEAGVSIVPGRVYGPEGAGYVRFSLTSPTARVEEAIERMTAWRQGADHH